MKKWDQKEWERLIKKHPEAAGMAWELYCRDKKKEANTNTYFYFAKKLLYRDEALYQKGLKKYKQKQKYEMELKNEKDDLCIS